MFRGLGDVPFGLVPELVLEEDAELEGVGEEEGEHRRERVAGHYESSEYRIKIQVRRGGGADWPRRGNTLSGGRTGASKGERGEYAGRESVVGESVPALRCVSAGPAKIAVVPPLFLHTRDPARPSPPLLPFEL